MSSNQCPQCFTAILTDLVNKGYGVHLTIDKNFTNRKEEKDLRTNITLDVSEGQGAHYHAVVSFYENDKTTVEVLLQDWVTERDYGIEQRQPLTLQSVFEILSSLPSIRTEDKPMILFDLKMVNRMNKSIKYNLDECDFPHRAVYDYPVFDSKHELPEFYFVPHFYKSS